MSMEFKFRAIDEQASTYVPPSSSIGYFTQQALRAGLSGPEFGRTGEMFRNHSPSDVREAIQREIEKERIREEIIAAEIARRRVLEAEVRRELMLEREMALRRSAAAEGFSLSLFEQRQSYQYEGGQVRSLLEDRLALSLEERLGYRARRGGIGGFETLPFQRNAEPKISEVKPPSEVSKDKVIFLTKPEENLSGAKRKAETPPAVSELPSVGLKKKHKEEWSCAICQVSATSERGLNEHLQGKKHKARAAALVAQRTGKNYVIGLFPKKTGKPIKLVEPSDNQNSEQEAKLEGESLKVNKSGEVILQKKLKTEDLKQSNDLALLVIQDTNDSKKKTGNSAQKMQKNGDYKKKKFRFWCEMCQIGAYSEKVMNNHKRGKKHVSRLQELNQNGRSLPAARVEEASQKEKDPEVVAEDEKEEKPDNVDGAADGEAVEDHQAAEDGAGYGTN